jgi:hypothetical protein
VQKSNTSSAKHLRIAICVFCVACSSLSAQELPAKQLYKALGAPSHPKVAAQWNRYHDYADATKLMQDLAKAYPDYCKLQSLGKTYGKRDMWVMTITNFAKGPENERSGFWIDAAIHANEIQASEVALYTGWYLLEMRDSEAIKRLLDERVFYILPMMSPDSRDAHFYEPNTTHSPRSGQRPFDDDQDGLIDEDDVDDIDGDGHIAMMRVRDSNGKYKPHADFSDLMVRVKDGEKGEYSLLGQEGIDNDGDGEVNEDADGYYDPNRDWGWNWQPPYVQFGAHRYPLSILENRMPADFIAAHPNIMGGQSYHNSGGMILRPPGAVDETVPGDDVRVYDVLGKRGEELLPGYRYMITGKDLYEVFGGSIDWMYRTRGVYAVTNELFTPFNFFRKTGHEGYFGSEEVRSVFDKYLLLGEAVVKWHEVDHPQYGKIEVGGVKKSFSRQPPSFLLEEECHRNMAFTLYHADQLPLVQVQPLEVKQLGGDLVQVTATIENSKLCPTHTAFDVANKITPADEVTISGKDLKVVTGLISSEPFFREPREQKRDPAVIKLDNLPGYSVTYVRWLVQGGGPYRVEVKTVKGGRHAVESAK